GSGRGLEKAPQRCGAFSVFCAGSDGSPPSPAHRHDRSRGMGHSGEQPAATPALHHAAALLHQAAQKIEQARLLLEGAGPADADRKWAAADMLVERVNIRLRLAGKACARILLRLMAEPGQMVPV